MQQDQDRFAAVTEAEIEQLLNKTESKASQQAEESWGRTFEAWLVETGHDTNQTGSEYCHRSLIAGIGALLRAFSRAHGKRINFFKDGEFIRPKAILLQRKNYTSSSICLNVIQQHLVVYCIEHMLL